jgi:hypothetical protein
LWFSARSVRRISKSLHIHNYISTPFPATYWQLTLLAGVLVDYLMNIWLF